MAIVVAVENSQQDPIVSEGYTLAEAFGEELHVVNVTTPPASDDIGPSMDGPEVVERFEKNAAEIAESAADSIAPDATFVGLVDDDVPGAIVGYAEKREARYLVVGGRRRSPTGKAIFGSTTQDILMQADCPVVTVMRRR